MSHSSSPRHRHGQHPSHHAGVASRHDEPAAHRRSAATAYTFAHAGRQLRLGPIAFWSIVGALVIMAAWSLVTATYFAFRDDLLTRLIARQAEMQYAYEDRIADLRAQVDRMASRQLLDQEQFEQRLEQALKRQSILESRAATLASSAADPTPTGSVKATARNFEPDRAPDAAAKASPISDTVILVPPPDREARLQSRIPTTIASRAGAGGDKRGVELLLTRLTSSLDRVEANQTVALNRLEQSYDARARRMRGVLTDLGLNASHISDAVGGPYVPVRPHADASTFERQFHRVSLARREAERLTRTFTTIPIRKPLAGAIDTTSSFGLRLDPFLRAPAMHTGLDLRGATGDPVRATATGKIVVAGWSGGYGKMVEIDHGNGLTTRYAHMSAIEVEEGQTVRIGQIVGRVGTTGRSSGPHLHYETRIDGEPLDPQKFLRAAIRLGSL